MSYKCLAKSLGCTFGLTQKYQKVKAVNSQAFEKA
jgi:hypothetical protein